MSRVAVIQLRLQTTKREVIEGLYFNLIEHVAYLNPVVNSSFTFSEIPDGGFDVKIQIETLIDSITEVMLVLDNFRSNYFDVLQTEELIEAINCSDSEVTFIGIQDSNEAKENKRRDQLIDFLVEKNNILQNELDECLTANTILFENFEALDAQVRNLSEEIDASKSYHYDLIKFSQLQGLVMELCNNTENEHLLEEFSTMETIQ